MVELREVKLGEITMYKVNIGQGKQGAGRLRMADQVLPLFDAEELHPPLKVRSRHTEFPHPAADIQNPGAIVRSEEPARQFRYVQGCPMQARQRLDRLRIQKG